MSVASGLEAQGAARGRRAAPHGDGHSRSHTDGGRAGRLRCAVYTRKSSEEGLEQEFNSLHAQRDACAAFILSQAGLGWRRVPDAYDDGGLSGGTMERPALQRLLGDIRDGKVDVVVVYKIDRLTRSLMDFARIVEVFDRHGVSFVSVTQAFNTTTSMGRLTLNVLLSFAQFEREVTAERIRDKIAASKRKGMWMGGVVPLGYRTVDKKLIVDPPGAERVQHIFERYLALQSVPALADELTRNSMAAASDPSVTNVPAVMKLTRPGMLYGLLSNPLYVGKLRHKEQIYDGEHAAIIEQQVFDRVQALLAEQAPRRKGLRAHPDIHLLSGMLVDDAGERLTPVHATRRGRRYRYYVSMRSKGRAGREHHTGAGRSDAADGAGWRVPAVAIETIALHQLRAVLQDRARLAGWVAEQNGSANLQAGLAVAERAAGAVDDDRTALRDALATVFRRIALGRDHIRFDVDVAATVRWLTETATGVAKPRRWTTNDRSSSACSDASGILPIVVPVTMKRRGAEGRLIVEGEGIDKRAPDQPLVDLLARAHAYLGALTDGSTANTVEVAALYDVHRAEVSRILPLAFLAPSLTAAILNGRQPADLSARKLSRQFDLPIAWNEQTQLLGF